MEVRVGINGFGRMGRLALRAAWGWRDFDFVHINEVKGGPEAAAHLLTFDSVQGRWERDARAEATAISVEGRRIGFSASSSLAEAPWRDARVDIILEASGKFRTTALLAPYFEQGVRKVIVAAPSKRAR
ncbi:MAG: glyceraldehyde 3-phosphate dehydrogenase NAD-binding domain-containing protein [Myxococcaceae bacterium]